MNTLAYIDDNSSNIECIELILKNNFEVQSFLDPLQFLKVFPESNYEAIMLDIHMPVLNGFELYEKIIEHDHYNGCPLIFISSDDSDENRIRSFSLGAVDFLNRHMVGGEILSRVNSKISYFKKHRNVIEFGSVKLNLTLLKAYLNEEELKLTFIEFKLLCHFLKTYPEMTPKEELIDKVWSDRFVLDATIYTHIFNLNAKLAAWDHTIVTERNKGIMLARKEPGKS